MMEQRSRQLGAANRREFFNDELAPAQPRFVFRGSDLRRQEPFVRSMLAAEPKLNARSVIVEGGNCDRWGVPLRARRRKKKQQHPKRK
jgi:hypothetical protein